MCKRKLFILLLFFFPFLLFSQELNYSTIVPQLKMILQQYETNIQNLKTRITELETRLKESENLSSSLMIDIPLLKAELSESKLQLTTLTNQSNLLNNQLQDYQKQLEISKQLTMNSLNSLQKSILSLKLQNLLMSSGIIVTIILLTISLLKG